MRISNVTIENYRSHKSTVVDFNNYTVLVGANGAGKSSVFYALRWFFDDGQLTDGDIHAAALQDSESARVSVSVTFSELSEADRHRLGDYARGDVAYFSRSWVRGDAKSKIVGNALAGPGFPDIKRETRVTFKRKLYATAASGLEDLPALGASPSAEAIDQALADWETAHFELLEQVSHVDANHLFGINGKNVIRECVRLILVPAATDISASVGGDGKGSTLSDLIGAVTSAASARAREAWMSKYDSAIVELNSTIKTQVEDAASHHALRINERLKTMVPNASIKFNSMVPEFIPRIEASVSTQVTVGETTNDLGNQGHGTQRAVMIAMFQALAPDETSLLQEMPQMQDEEDNDYDARLLKAKVNLPALIICVEEPEIYQHPVRARAFARVLSQISQDDSIQIAVATHSPYFAPPAQFEDLRRLSLHEGNSSVAATTASAAAKTSGSAEGKFLMTVERHLPTVFAEGFFAEAVVLVEGDTDKVCLEGIADLLGFSFDLAGISVIHVGGKVELRMAYSILNALLVPVYIIVDGDSGRADAKYTAGTPEHAKALASNAKQTTDITAWLPTGVAASGVAPYTFGSDSVLTDKYAIWKDDLESELAAWPSFISELLAQGGALRDKKVMTYRAAVLGASAADVPGNLRQLVATVRAFAGH
jgi:putative ATP-dependent endonuclease of OLD family